MARPLTKSPPINFRVPIEWWPQMEAKAAALNMNVRDWVYHLLVVDLAEPGDPSPACKHQTRKVKLISGGLARCDCGATRNMRGVWSGGAS